MYRNRLRVLLLSVLLAWLPGSLLSAQASGTQRATSIESGVDTRIAPGDDFFGWANGSWIAATTLPPGKERLTGRIDIDNTTRQQLAKVFDEARTQPAGSSARKVADFRAAYLNETAIEARGIAPLAPLLKQIDGLQDKTALARFLGSDIGSDVDPLNQGVFQSHHLLGLSVEMGVHGEKANVAFLLQGGLGLPDRENYVGTAPEMAALRTQYQAYVGRLFSLAHFDTPDQRAAAVIALETKLAQVQANQELSASDRNAGKPWSRADFGTQAPGMDWGAFFTAAGLSSEKAIVPWQPDAVKGTAALVGSESLQGWQDYLRFHVIDANADVLPRAFAEAALALHTAAAGAASPKPRDQRALEATQLALSDAIGRMYAERFFPADQKLRVETIVANVTAAFARHLETVAWMSPETRAVALTKVKRLYVGIGYPEQWQDYSDLVIDSLDAVGNLQRVAARDHRRMVARLGRPVDLREWWMPPQTVGAVLIFQQNTYDFAAALLQAPKYDPAGSDAAAYGAIGAVIGHDVTHFVDVLGADYDLDGAQRRWWTAADSTRFEAASASLVRQFSSYRPLPDQNINGKLTITENVADLGGLTAAFEAYRATLGRRGTDPEYVRQHDREFFIAFARSMRSKMTDKGMRNQLTNDHAPEQYRVATVRNLDAWYDAFAVKPGQALYLPPAERVRVW